MRLSSRSESSRLGSRIRGKLQVARHVHLHPVSLANRDGWQTIQEPAHDLKACLRRGVRAAGDDDRPVTRSIRKASSANPLRQAADKTHRSGSSERGPVVVVDLVAQARVADLIEAQELIEAQRAAVRHQEPVKGHGEPRLAQRLNWSRLAENACPRGNQHVLPAVGVHRVRDQAVDGGRSTSVEAVGQYGVDDRSLQQRVQRARGADWVRSLRRAFASVAGRWSGRELRRSPTGLERPNVLLPRSPRL